MNNQRNISRRTLLAASAAALISPKFTYSFNIKLNVEM